MVSDRQGMSMNATTRKRAAAFPLDKPLASRLTFEKEHVAGGRAISPTSFVQLDIGHVASPGPRGDALVPYPSASEFVSSHLKYTPEKKRQRLSTISEVAISEVAACDRMEVIDASGGRRKHKSMRKWSTTRETAEGYTACAAISAAPQKRDEQGAAAPWGSGGWLGLPRREEKVETCCRGEQSCQKDVEDAPGRALVQLKIDAMFTSEGAQKAPQSSYPPKSDSSLLRGSEGFLGEEGMEVDDGGVGANDIRAEIGPTCYVCRGGLGTDGGDVLCSFCDRAACERCSQSCFTCDLPHCSLCLAADFSTQFEIYFCPPCHRNRQHESAEHVAP